MIRQATKYDIPKITEMMRKYALEAPVEAFKDSINQDPAYFAQLIYELIAGKGFVLVDNQLNGMLIAAIMPNIWCPKVYELKELAWWIKPEYRKGTLGGKLWIEFNKRGNELLNSKRFNIVYSTEMVSSPSLNYEKRDYKKLETTYFKE
jgi:N-acetylglutamate synthase-like GNAT family acetyltransferase